MFRDRRRVERSVHEYRPPRVSPWPRRVRLAGAIGGAVFALALAWALTHFW